MVCRVTLPRILKVNSLEKEVRRACERFLEHLRCENNYETKSATSAASKGRRFDQIACCLRSGMYLKRD